MIMGVIFNNKIFKEGVRVSIACFAVYFRNRCEFIQFDEFSNVHIRLPENITREERQKIQEAAYELLDHTGVRTIVKPHHEHEPKGGDGKIMYTYPSRVKGMPDHVHYVNPEEAGVMLGNMMTKILYLEEQVRFKSARKCEHSGEGDLCTIPGACPYQNNDGVIC